jgi:pyruvate ferredoxin oxidoreductase alpha subunit
MSACLGSAATGARTFTATASQGLALMNEVVYVAAPMRLPIVMAVANRALSAPLSIWGDHSDMMSVRDTGWIQIVTENGQQAFDNTIVSFRVAEDQRVLLPNHDAPGRFQPYSRHRTDRISFTGRVDKYLPKNQFPLPLNPDRPVNMGGFGAPNIFMEAKWAQEMNLRNSKDVIIEAWDEFARIFGRKYNPIEKYHSDGAKILILTMGAQGETASVAIDELRKEGLNVGQVRIRLWRPFPFDELREAVSDADVLIVIDRALSYGGPGGPVASEVKAALYNQKKRPAVVPFVISLGGRDTTVSGYKDIVKKGMVIAEKGSKNEYEIYGVRE